MKKFILLSLILIITFLPISVLAEESLTITRWIVNSSLLENGNLDISEDLTFDFKDKLNGVFRYVILKGTDGISNIDLYEIQNGKEIKYTLDESAKKGDSNVYNYEFDNEGVNLKIFAPSKAEEKTFRIKYTLENVAIIHKDTGEFYYKYLGSENKTPIKYFSATLTLPKFEKDIIKIFAHGPENGTINFIDNDLIKLEVVSVPINTFIEARVLFPSEYIPISSRMGNSNLNNIIEEEQSFVRAIAEKANKRQQAKGILNKVSIMITVLGAILAGFLYKAFKRDPEIFNNMNSLYPKEISPAELNLFMNQIVNSRGLMASIFDLARREYLTIDEIENVIKYKKKSVRQDYILFKSNKPSLELLVHEKYLLDWLFNEIGNGHEVTTEEIDLLRSKRPVVFSKGYNQWLKLIKQELDNRGYQDKKSKKTAGILIILSLLVFVPGVISVIFGGLYGIGVILLSLFLFVYGLILLYRKSDEGFIQYGLWKDFMKETENLRVVDIGIPRDKSLIYAVTLGLNTKKLDSYRRLMGNEYYPVYWGYWYFLYNSKGGSAFEDRFNKSFFGATGTSSASTTTFGGGGGFSGGGGGGAGGGGAGGF